MGRKSDLTAGAWQHVLSMLGGAMEGDPDAARAAWRALVSIGTRAGMDPDAAAVNAADILLGTVTGMILAMLEDAGKDPASWLAVMRRHGPGSAETRS